MYKGACDRLSNVLRKKNAHQKIQFKPEKMEFQTLVERQVFGRVGQKLYPMKLCTRNAERCPKATGSHEKKKERTSRSDLLISLNEIFRYGL